MMPTPRSRRAFTLIELLVVISIVALLVSILLPALARAREAAVNTQCQAQFRQLGLIWHVYLENNQYFMPDNSWFKPKYHSSMSTLGYPDTIAFYFKPSHTGSSPLFVQCPERTPEDLLLSGYSNGATIGYNDSWWENGARRWDQVRHPSNILVLADSTTSRIFNSNYVGDYVLRRHGGMPSGVQNVTTGRKANLLMADWHVEPVAAPWSGSWITID